MNQATPKQAQGETQGKEFLIFTLANQEYGIDILKVQEIRGYDSQTVTRIANVPSFVKGVTNLRLKFNMDNVEYTSQTVVVILNVRSRIVGVVVDGVSDVLILQTSQISAAPQFGSAFSTEHLTGIGTVGERMLILVDIEKLMTSEEMALVEDAVA